MICPKCLKPIISKKSHDCLPVGVLDETEVIIDNKTGDVTEKVLAEHVKDLPEVVPDVIQAAMEQTKLDEKLELDSSGQAFNHEKHLKGSDGQPVFTPNGKFKKIPKLNVPKDFSSRVDTEVPDEFQKEAHQWTVLTATIAIMVLGKEGEPSDIEFKTISGGYEGVFRKYGCLKMGPELTLFSALAGFISARIQKPGSRAREMFTGFCDWVKKILTGKKKG